jgi:dihydroorotase-like cyclic amidohydrolase
VDIDETWIVENDKLQTKCKWSPFNGWEMKGKVKCVFIRGKKVFGNDIILVESGFGKILP